VKVLRTVAVLGFAAPLVVATAALAPAEPTPLTATGTVRLAGADRFETSAAVSQNSFGPPQEVAFVASGMDFPDALAGGAAAAKRVAPLLLTRSDALPSAIASELQRLLPTKIYILGGTGAVNGTAASALSAIAPTERIGGSDRYATAAAVSEAMFPTASTAYIASGLGFADALSGGPAAAKQGAPLLLTGTTSLPAATRTELLRLNPSSIKILGGTGAVSSQVEDQIRAALPAAAITRYSGPDRYATAAAVVTALWPAGSPTVFYASGTAFPDGLSATPAASINSAPLLLSTADCMPSATSSATKALNPSLSVFTGGAAAVSSTTTVCESTPTPPAPTTPPPPTRDYNCSDFTTWAGAQAMFEQYYPAYGDIFGLDADGDLIACETLPGAP
jgi:putative cell wall-binding protein